MLTLRSNFYTQKRFSSSEGRDSLPELTLFNLFVGA
jgi:hypothetical protein